MEKLLFRTLADDQGRIEKIEMGGLLVVETAHQLKNELVAIENRLSKNLIINIHELEEMDLSGVQLLIAFIRQANQKKVSYQFKWDIDKEMETLFLNVGIGVELFMNK